MIRERTVEDRTDTFCVVGAGSSGLAALKNLRQYGFRAECFERAPAAGGCWDAEHPTSRVYASTHMISSRPFSQFDDFPMPDDWPDYPHHTLICRYFRAYAEHFDLLPHIRFATHVVRIAAVEARRAWEVTVQGEDGAERTAQYAGVVLANGHNWYPKWPRYQGEFTGSVLHSRDYTGAEQLEGKRVLVIGGGNTGCDITVDGAHRAAHVFHSMRRAYWFVPKLLFGRPADQVYDLILALRLPGKVKRRLVQVMLQGMVGDLRRYGLPDPRRDGSSMAFFNLNSLVLHYARHGRVTFKPDVDRFDGRHAVFTDGTRQEIDLVVYCTGYRADFGMLADPGVLNVRDGEPWLYLNVFTPAHDNLFVAGLIQPDSGQFNLVHWQTVAIAEFLTARERRPHAARRLLATAERALGAVQTTEQRGDLSTRRHHAVSHHHYLAALEQTVADLRTGYDSQESHERTSDGPPVGLGAATATRAS